MRVTLDGRVVRDGRGRGDGDLGRSGGASLRCERHGLLDQVRVTRVLRLAEQVGHLRVACETRHGVDDATRRAGVDGQASQQRGAAGVVHLGVGRVGARLAQDELAPSGSRLVGDRDDAAAGLLGLIHQIDRVDGGRRANSSGGVGLEGARHEAERHDHHQRHEGADAEARALRLARGHVVPPSPGNRDRLSR